MEEHSLEQDRSEEDNLRFDEEMLRGQRLLGVLGRGVEESPGGISMDSVAICMEEATLVLSVNPGNTAEFSLDLSPWGFGVEGYTELGWQSLDALAKHFGNAIAGCWRNDEELFGLTFEGSVGPQLIFVVAGSVIYFYELDAG